MSLYQHISITPILESEPLIKTKKLCNEKEYKFIYLYLWEKCTEGKDPNLFIRNLIKFTRLKCPFEPV